MAPALETIDHVGQARRSLCQVRRVDLSNVTQTDDFRPRTGTGHQRFHLFGGQVLRFIDDQVLTQKSTAAHEAHGLHLDPRLDQIVCSGTSPVATAFALIEHLKVVFERAHPGLHFFFFCTWQVTNVFADGDRCARHDDLTVALALEYLR